MVGATSMHQRHSRVCDADDDRLRLVVARAGAVQVLAIAVIELGIAACDLIAAAAGAL